MSRVSDGMRVGYIVPEFPSQTHSMFWMEILRLRAAGVSVDVISTRHPNAVPARHSWAIGAASETIYLHPLGIDDLFRCLWLLLRMPPRILRQLIRFVVCSERKGFSKVSLILAILFAARLVLLASSRHWDHLHVHSCAYSADIARFARILGGPSYSLTLHGPLGDYGPDQVEKWSRASFGVVITRRLLDDFVDSVGMFLSIPMVVCGMGVDVARYVRPSPYVPWSGSGPAHVFSCGRLNPAKGHLLLIQAVEVLRSKGIDVRCSIAGEDEEGGIGYRRVLERYVVDAGLSGVVKLLGSVSDDEVAECLFDSQVFVLASISEPLGVAIMEAMAAGLPVIATNAGGVPELVSDGVDGLLVAPSSVDSIVWGIGCILGDASLAERLGDAARRSAEFRAKNLSSADVLLEMIGRTRVQND